MQLIDCNCPVSAACARHSGKANVLFVNFHDETVNGEQLTLNDNLKKYKLLELSIAYFIEKIDIREYFIAKFLLI